MGGGKKNQSSSTAPCNVIGIHTLHEFRSKPTAESIRVRIPRLSEKMSTPTLLNILTKEISSKLCSIGFTFWGFDQSIWINYFKNFRRRKPKISAAKKHDPPQLNDEQKSSEMDGLLHCAVRNSSARLLLTTKNPMRDPPRPPRSYEIIRAHEMLLTHRDRCKTVPLPCIRRMLLGMAYRVGQEVLGFRV